MTKQKTFLALAAVASASVLSACGSMAGLMGGFSQDSLPAAVQVPAGNKVAFETVGVGIVTYECKAGANGAFDWALSPDAKLLDRSGKQVGKYYGPPATWESSDGSKFTGTQVAVAPSAPGDLPLQLVKANPATGMGAFNGVTFVQRVATKGGAKPTDACTTAQAGQKKVLGYQADYILWKAN